MIFVGIPFFLHNCNDSELLLKTNCGHVTAIIFDINHKLRCGNFITHFFQMQPRLLNLFPKVTELGNEESGIRLQTLFLMKEDII